MSILEEKFNQLLNVISDLSQLTMESLYLQNHSYHLTDESEISRINLYQTSSQGSMVAVAPSFNNCSKKSEKFFNINQYYFIFLILIFLAAFLLVIFQKLNEILSGPGGLRGYFVRVALGNVLRKKTENRETFNNEKTFSPDRSNSHVSETSDILDAKKYSSYNTSRHQNAHNHIIDHSLTTSSSEISKEKYPENDLYTRKIKTNSSNLVKTKQFIDYEYAASIPCCMTILEYILNEPIMLEKIYPTKSQKTVSNRDYFNRMFTNTSPRNYFKTSIEEMASNNLLGQNMFKHQIESRQNRKKTIEFLNNYSNKAISKFMADPNSANLFTDLKIQQIFMESSKNPLASGNHFQDINKGPTLIRIQNAIR